MSQAAVKLATVTPELLVQRARDLIPKLKERAAKTESARQLPAETIAEMKAAGLFDVLKPKMYGGYEMDPQVFYDVQMALAEGCMSTAWVYGVVGVHNWQIALFDPRAAQDVFGKDPSTLIASTYMPKGQVTPVEGGFKFSGRWGFSSCQGCATRGGEAGSPGGGGDGCEGGRLPGDEWGAALAGDRGQNGRNRQRGGGRKQAAAF